MYLFTLIAASLIVMVSACCSGALFLQTAFIGVVWLAGLAAVLLTLRREGAEEWKKKQNTVEHETFWK